MVLLIVYICLMIVGDFVAYLIGLVIEKAVPGASLPAFLAMYFLFLGLAWLIAVRITEPRAQPAPSAADLAARVDALEADGMSRRDAIAEVARSTGVRRRDVYDAAHRG